MDVPSIVRTFAYAVVAVGSVMLAILYLQYYRIKRQTTWLARTMIIVMLAWAVVSVVGMILIWCRSMKLTCEQDGFLAFTWALVALAIAVTVSVAEHALVLARHNRDMDEQEAAMRAATDASVSAVAAIVPPAPVAPSIAPATTELAASTAAVAYSAVDAAQATADVANKAVDVAKAAAASSDASAPHATTSDVAARSATVATLAGDVAALSADVASEISKITQERQPVE